MANKDLPKGFQLVHPNNAFCIDYLVADADSLKAGDTVYLDSSGYASDTASGIALGVAMSNIIDGYTGAVNDTAATASYDYISVCVDRNAIYVAQISTGALTDPYTTRSSAACFDEAGDAGAQYINAAASTNDTWKVIGAASEKGDGSKSVVGAYQKVYCQFNLAKFFLGTIA